MLSNSTKVWIFILLSSLGLVMLGYNLGERLGLFVGFLFAIGLNFFVFFYGESQILVSLNAKELKGQDPWNLQETISKYTNHLGIAYPSVYLIPAKVETAFCVSHSWRKGTLAISMGLLEKFSPEDLEAVVAYQVCHLQRMDSFRFGVTNTIANALVGLGRLLDHFWPPNYFLLANQKQQPFLKIFSPLAWTLVKVASSHKIYFQNDLHAAELLHDRFRLAEVLWRLEGLAQTQPIKAPPCSSHLFIVNPEGYTQNLFMKSHPSIQVRLQKLMGYYPI
ncbi:MAG: M48 family metalloprotease [Bdellovibrionaceae bacterium]|nr:M48 family metalloprotease [Pseudobdellovibrionaceae bacterium]